MIKLYLTLSFLLTFIIVLSGCHLNTEKSKMMGSWHSEDKKISLKITSRNFTLDEGNSPIAESYFVKGDTVFTSYEGSQPYIKFVIKDLLDKSLTLVYPDSISVKFMR